MTRQGTGRCTSPAGAGRRGVSAGDMRDGSGSLGGWKACGRRLGRRLGKAVVGSLEGDIAGNALGVGVGVGVGRKGRIGRWRGRSLGM